MSSSSSAVSLPRLEYLDAELARRSLVEFIRQGWHVLEPATPLIWNWHLDAICEHLEAVTRGQIRNLLINVPPGHMKSLAVSVCWPAWMWVDYPGWRTLASSYDDTLVLRDAVKARTLMESEWYQRSFRPQWQLKPDQNAKSFYVNTQGGFRLSHTVGGAATGHRGNLIMVDDAMKVADAYSPVARETVKNWWKQTMSNRLSDMRKGAKVVIMQRLHEDDLSGIILEEGGFEHLCLPSEFETSRKSRTKLGWEDPRREEGELLFPEMFPQKVLEGEKRVKGSAGYAGQYQQSPMPSEGGMFKKDWWRFWRYRDQPEIASLTHRTVIIERARPLERMAISVDCTFKGVSASQKAKSEVDRVAAGAWFLSGPDKFLIDLEWAQMDIIQTLAAVNRLASSWPQVLEILVEDKANGPAVITLLQNKLSGLVAVNPQGGKESRAAATAPQVEAGNVFLPLHAPWRDKYIEEHAAFPKGSHDDAVDQQSQLLLRWGNNSQGGYNDDYTSNKRRDIEASGEEEDDD